MNPVSFSCVIPLFFWAQMVLSFAPMVPTRRTTTNFLPHKDGSSRYYSLPPKKGSSDVQVCLQTLEKRIKEGPGALSSSEVSEVESAIERIVEEMGSKPATQATPSSEKVLHDSDVAAKLRTAVKELDTTTVASLLEAGAEMDEATTNEAFWAVVQAVDLAEAEDRALAADVPRMLHHIFDADLRHLLGREKITINVTCMQPDESQGLEAAARRMNYIFDDSAHKDLPLTEGRKCEGGACCDKCSRNIFRTFATEEECSLETFPELASLTFNNLETISAATIIQFVRLIERVRRTMAHEYGLPLSSILPLQAYSRKYVAGTTQKGGGGGEGDFVTLHTDEATHSGYHYSSVLYLSTQGVDFEGGDFVFNDPAENTKEAMKDDTEDEDLDENDDLFQSFLRGELPEDTELFDEEPTLSVEEEFRRAGRELTPFHPSRGAAVIFSSGWENMHEVEKITSGIRYAVPAFFTTCPVPDAAYEQMSVGKPKTDEDIADDWLHLLLAHRKEEPMESVGRVKELLMKWHYLCTPLTEH